MKTFKASCLKHPFGSFSVAAYPNDLTKRSLLDSTSQHEPSMNPGRLVHKHQKYHWKTYSWLLFCFEKFLGTDNFFPMSDPVLKKAEAIEYGSNKPPELPGLQHGKYGPRFELGI